MVRWGGNRLLTGGAPQQGERGAHDRVRLGCAGEEDPAGEVLVAEGAVEAARGALGVDRGEDRAGLGGGVGDRGDQGAARAAVLVGGWTCSSVMTKESSSQASVPWARRYGSTTVDHQWVRSLGMP